MPQYPQIASEWLQDKKMMYDSEGSYKVRHSDLNQYLKWLQNNSKSFEPIEKTRHKNLLHRYFLNLKDEGYSRNTIASRWSTLSIFYGDMAGFYNKIDETPFEELFSRSSYIPDKTREETKSEKPYVTRKQKEKLCDNVPSPAFRNETMIRLMWQTGLRQSEVANLKVGDIDLDANKLSKFWSPKVKIERTVTFKDSLSWWLDQWLNAGYRSAYTGASDSQYLFLTHRSEKMANAQPNNIIKNTAENAGIQYPRIEEDKAGKTRWAITSHAIRRGHAMHLLKNDVDLRTIQKRLGHAKLQTSIEYLPISPEDTSEKIESIQF